MSPVKVEDVKTSPDPFIIGQSPLRLSMMVKVPLSNKDSKILEVSALITSPTRRSMSFVSRRLSLAEATEGGVLRFVPVELEWDGKDQYDQLVGDGSYFYEIRAKLLEDTGEGPRTKVVSRRVQGTLEVLAYEGEVLPSVPSEPEVPEEIESLEQQELAADDLPVIEGEVKPEEESVLLEEAVMADQVFEGSSGGESGAHQMNGQGEGLVSERVEEGMSATEETMEAVDADLDASPTNTVQPSATISEQSLESVSTEPSSVSETNPSLH